MKDCGAGGGPDGLTFGRAYALVLSDEASLVALPP